MLRLVISVLGLLLSIAGVHCGGGYYGGPAKGAYYGGPAKGAYYGGPGKVGYYGGPGGPYGPFAGVGYGAGLGLGYPEAVPGLGFLNGAGFLGLPFLAGYGAGLGIGPGIIG